MISNHEIFEYSFDSKVQDKLKLILTQKSPWVAHRTPTKNLKSIKQYGLHPKDTGAIYFPETVTRHYGERPKILCLAPFESRHNWQNLQHHDGGQTFLVAPFESVRSPIGIDWSFPNVWNKVAETADLADRIPPEILFANSILAEAVFVSYGPIESTELYVVNENSDADNPETYTRLSEIPDADLN